MEVQKKNLIFCCVIFCVVVSTKSQFQQKVCKGINEYCQNHWECCSNSCLSYSYRCVKSNQDEYSNIDAQYAATFIQQPQKPSKPNKYSTLEQLLSSLFAPTPSPPPPPAKDDIDVSILTRIDDETDQQLSSTASSSTTTATVQEDCKEIGQKCFKNNECCTQRCHGFLHQCVT